MLLGKLNSYLYKKEIRTLTNTTHKNKLKWVKDPYVRLNTIKLLEENICRTLFDINHSSFLDPPPRVMEMKTKINKWDLIRLECFCTAKETIKKQNKKTTYRIGENICK